MNRRAEFDALYQRHSREVWALAYARRLDADAAMDVTQEAFLRLWKQWQAGGTIGNVRAWLMRVARNLAEDVAKSSFHRHGTSPPEDLAGLRAAMILPLVRMEVEETRAAVRAALAELPAVDRDMLTLKYALDYDAARIAVILEIQIAAVHMRLSRARQRLAERLNALGWEAHP